MRGDAARRSQFMVMGLVCLLFGLIPLGQAFETKLALPRSPHVVLAVLIWGVVLFRFVVTGRIQNWPSVLNPYLLLLAWAAASIFWTPSIPAASSLLVRQIQLGMLALVPLAFVNVTWEIALGAVLSYWVGNISAAGLALASFMAGEVYFGGRLTYDAQYNPSAFGAHLAASLAFLPALWPQKKLRSVLALASAFLVFCLILAQARNAIIALVVSSICCGSLSMARRGFAVSPSGLTRTLLVVSGIVAVVTAVTIGVAHGMIDASYIERITATLQLEDGDRATAGRTSAWDEYLRLDDRIMGYGWGATAKAGELVGARTRHQPHNIFLTLYVELGIVGAAIFSFFCLNLIRRSSLILHTWSVLPAFFLVWLGFGNDVILYTYFWTPLGLLLMLVAAGSRPHARSLPNATTDAVVGTVKA